MPGIMYSVCKKKNDRQSIKLQTQNIFEYTIYVKNKVIF